MERDACSNGGPCNSIPAKISIVVSIQMFSSILKVKVLAYVALYNN